MRTSIFAALVLLTALPAAALGFHGPFTPNCTTLTSPSAAIDLAPNQVMELPVFGPGCTVTDVVSLFPNLISVEKVTRANGSNGITSVTLRALSPGLGELSIHTNSWSGTRDFLALMTVDDCSEGAHTIKMPAAISAFPRTVLTLSAEVHGEFTGKFDWYIGGVYVGSGTSTFFATSDTGSWDVMFRAESVCGTVEGHTTLTVIPSRAHSARH